MKIALLTAAGVGNRMGQNVPKQFISIYDKPVIVYTMEAFQKHPQIDKIVVVCLDGWEGMLKAYAKQFNITKLQTIIKGGESGFESIRNGIFEIRKEYKDDDMILIHDGVRAFLEQNIITNCILTCEKYGNAITVTKCVEPIIETHDSISSHIFYDRDKLVRTQTPQAFYLNDICSAYLEATEKGITTAVAPCNLFNDLGRKVYFSIGSDKNLKLTTVDDLEILKALLKLKKEN